MNPEIPIEFDEFLSDLLSQHKGGLKNAADLARSLREGGMNVSDSLAQKWVRGERIPDFTYLAKIADRLAQMI